MSGQPWADVDLETLMTFRKSIAAEAIELRACLEKAGRRGTGDWGRQEQRRVREQALFVLDLTALVMKITRPRR